MQDQHHDLGLAHDIDTLLRLRDGRRRALRWIAGAGGLALLGCGGGGSGTGVASSSGDSAAGAGASAGTGTGTSTGTGSGGTSSGTATATGTGNCPAIPEETAGPYPGDGSNASNGSIANALILSGIVRSDIRASIAGASGAAEGVLLTVTLRLVNANGGCADLSGYAIYLWHCDREGRYSMYSPGVTQQNYLRGVQVTGSGGTVAFTTVFPGCYDGRMPHMHFEVYKSANSASSYSNKLKTSQLALPTDICGTVYGTAAGYGASVANLQRISFGTDNVFSDGVGSQMATVSGSVAQGYAAALTVGIPA